MNSKGVFHKNRQLEKEKCGGEKESKIQTVKDTQACDMFSQAFFLNNGLCWCQCDLHVGAAGINRV